VLFRDSSSEIGLIFFFRKKNEHALARSLDKEFTAISRLLI
jgi:hypothetical protein